MVVGGMKMAPISRRLVKEVFPKRDKETQKWDYGHCLVIAGSRRLLGAAVMTTKAALRGGAGLVTLATPRSLQFLVYSQILEALTLPLEETQEGVVAFGALDTVLGYVKDRAVTSVVVGPGLTRGPAQFISALTKKLKLPMVLDADAINVKPPLAGSAFRCLTPHRRELMRLVGSNEADVSGGGFEAARRFAAPLANVCLVLKGYRTKIFFKEKIFVNTTGNPGMAKGGSGDVLAGLMGAFLAQCYMKRPHEYLENVLASVYLHGLAGDLASKALSEVAMNAEDVITYLPEAMKKTGIR